MNERMQAYLRKNVNIALEMMIRDNSLGHAFDFDSEGVFVFVMAVVPRHEFEKAQIFTTPSNPLDAATPAHNTTCEHQWDGERIPFGESGSVATCSRCGEAAVDLRLLGEQTPQRAGTPVRRETLEPTSTADSGTKGEEGA